MLIAGLTTGARQRARRVLIVGAAASLWALLNATVGHAGDGERRYDFDVRKETLGAALDAIARQTDLIVLYPNELAGKTGVQPVVGRYTVREAIDVMLRGTRLSGGLTEHGVIYISISDSDQARNGENDMTGRTVNKSLWASTAALLFGVGAHAQESGEQSANAASDSAGEPSGIEEIIVTAQKRSERLQDVPMSIAVIGTQDIERRGLIGMEDYLRSIPGVSQIDQGPAANAVVIRGVATSPQFENFSSGTTVGTYFDETSITAAAGLGAGGIDVRPVDLARIEVLRGPQGTTFGSASLGGAVRLVPQRPVMNDFSGRVAGSLSATDGSGGTNSMVQGIFNMPLVTDRLALRAVAYRFDDSGVYDNIVGTDPASLAVADRFGVGSTVLGYTQDDVGQTVSTGARLSATWAVSDSVDATLVYLHQDIEQDGWPLATLGGYQQARFPIAPQARLRGERGEVADSNIDLANAVIDVDLGALALTSVLSLVDSGSQSASTVQSATSPRSTTNGSEFQSVSGEVRLRSAYTGALQFLIGAFYEDIADDYLQTSDWPGMPATNPFRTDPIFHFEQTRDLEQLAAFGEISYAITDRLKVLGGARRFEYEKSEGQLSEGGLVNVPLGSGLPTSFNDKDTETSWKAGLTYEPTDDTLFYTTWTQGFRLGRATAGLPASQCDVDQDGVVDGTNISLASARLVDSDFLDNYELGAKLTLADGRVFIDGAVYRIEWDGLPIRQLVASCGQAYTANVGSAKSEGAELQVRFVPIDGLQIDIGGSHNRAELVQDAPGLNARKGAPLPGSPDWSANLAIQYDMRVRGYDAFVRSDALYAGEFYGDLLKSPNTLSGGYVKVDVRVGMKVRSLRAELFVKNLTNEDDFTWRGLTNANAYFGYRLRPRTVGLELGFAFQ